MTVNNFHAVTGATEHIHLNNIVININLLFFKNLYLKHKDSYLMAHFTFDVISFAPQQLLHVDIHYVPLHCVSTVLNSCCSQSSLVIGFSC